MSHYQITPTDSGKFALTFEPDAQGRSQGLRSRPCGLFRTRDAANRAKAREERRSEMPSAAYSARNKALVNGKDA